MASARQPKSTDALINSATPSPLVGAPVPVSPARGSQTNGVAAVPSARKLPDDGILAETVVGVDEGLAKVCGVEHVTGILGS